MLHSDTMWNLFLHISFLQTMLTLIVKLYKTNSIKYNLKRNLSILNSIAHSFLNILTADMIHDFKNVRLKSFSKCSKQLSNISDIPLDESSYNPNDTTGISPNPNGITSPPPFYTKRPSRNSKMTRLNFFQNASNVLIKHFIMFIPNLILNHPYHIILLSPQIPMITL